MTDPLRWRDPTGLAWTAMLTEDELGLHFSVRGNGGPPTDDQIVEASLAHDHGRWAPRDVADALVEVTELTRQLNGDLTNPWVRQFVQPRKRDVIVKMVETGYGQRP